MPIYEINGIIRVGELPLPKIGDKGAARTYRELALGSGGLFRIRDSPPYRYMHQTF